MYFLLSRIPQSLPPNSPYSDALNSNLRYLEDASNIAGIIPLDADFNTVKLMVRTDMLNLTFPTESVPCAIGRVKESIGLLFSI